MLQIRWHKCNVRIRGSGKGFSPLLYFKFVAVPHGPAVRFDFEMFGLGTMQRNLCCWFPISEDLCSLPDPRCRQPRTNLSLDCTLMFWYCSSRMVMVSLWSTISKVAHMPLVLHLRPPGDGCQHSIPTRSAACVALKDVLRNHISVTILEHYFLTILMQPPGYVDKSPPAWSNARPIQTVPMQPDNCIS